MDTTLRYIFKAMILEAGILSVIVCWLAANANVRRARVVPVLLLTAAAGAAVFGYFEFGHFRYGKFVNPNEIFHYYLNSKYFREVGYFDLYDTALVASNDVQGFSSPTVANLRDYTSKPAAVVLRDAALYREHFTPERWEEFKKDILFVQSLTSNARWRRYLNDLGYNATPVWNMVGGLFARNLQTDSPHFTLLLMSLDWILLATMLIFVCWAFGWEVACCAAIFVGVNFFSHFAATKGAFLRWDWLAFLVVGICLLKRSHYKSAGAVLAYSVLLRIFPVVFLFGLFAKGMWTLITTRQVKREYRQFAIAFCVVVALLVGLSCVSGGVDSWKSFSEKIGIHHEKSSVTVMGFRTLFLGQTEAIPNYVSVHRENFKDNKIYWWLIQGAVLLLMALLVQRLDDVEAVGACYCIFFFLFAPQYYYQVALLATLFLFAQKMERLPNAIGVALLFLVSGLPYFLLARYPLSYPKEVFLLYCMSCFVAAYVCYILFFVAATFISRNANTRSEHGVSPLLGR